MSTCAISSRKPAEVCADKKVGGNGCDVADNVTFQKGFEGADVWVVAAVLHDGEGLARLLSKFEHLERLSHTVRQRLFAQHVAARPECFGRDLKVGRRDGAVENEVGGCFRQDSCPSRHSRAGQGRTCRLGSWATSLFKSTRATGSSPSSSTKGFSHTSLILPQPTRDDPHHCLTPPAVSPEIT